jgi:hypothetical protein
MNSRFFSYSHSNFCCGCVTGVMTYESIVQLHLTIFSLHKIVNTYLLVVVTLLSNRSLCNGEDRHDVNCVASKERAVSLRSRSYYVLNYLYRQYSCHKTRSSAMRSNTGTFDAKL